MSNYYSMTKWTRIMIILLTASLLGFGCSKNNNDVVPQNPAPANTPPADPNSGLNTGLPIYGPSEQPENNKNIDPDAYGILVTGGADFSQYYDLDSPDWPEQSSLGLGGLPPVAPGEIVTAWAVNSDYGLEDVNAAFPATDEIDGYLPRELGDTIAFIDVDDEGFGTPVDLFFVSNYQINFMIPEYVDVGPQGSRVTNIEVWGYNYVIDDYDFVLDGEIWLVGSNLEIFTRDTRPDRPAGEGFSDGSGPAAAIIHHVDDNGQVSFSEVAEDSIIANPGDLIDLYTTGLNAGRDFIYDDIEADSPEYYSMYSLNIPDSLTIFVGGVEVPPEDIVYAGKQGWGELFRWDEAIGDFIRTGGIFWGLDQIMFYLPFIPDDVNPNTNQYRIDDLGYSAIEICVDCKWNGNGDLIQGYWVGGDGVYGEFDGYNESNATIRVL